MKKLVTLASDPVKLVSGLYCFDKITRLEKVEYCQPMYLAMTNSYDMPASLVEHRRFLSVSKNSEALMTRLRERELANGHLCKECSEASESQCAIYQAEQAKTDDDTQYVKIAIRAKPKVVGETADYTGGNTTEEEANAINDIGVTTGEESYWVKYVRAAEKRDTTARAKKDLGKSGWEVLDESRDDFGGVVHVQGEDDNGPKEVESQETGLLGAFARLFN